MEVLERQVRNELDAVKIEVSKTDSSSHVEGFRFQIKTNRNLKKAACLSRLSTVHDKLKERFMHKLN